MTTEICHHKNKIWWFSSWTRHQITANSYVTCCLKVTYMGPSVTFTFVVMMLVVYTISYKSVILRNDCWQKSYRPEKQIKTDERSCTRTCTNALLLQLHRSSVSRNDSNTDDGWNCLVCFRTHVKKQTKENQIKYCVDRCLKVLPMATC